MKYPFSRLGKKIQVEIWQIFTPKIHCLECAQDRDVSKRSNQNKWLFFIAPCGGNEMISHLRWEQEKKLTLYIGSVVSVDAQIGGMSEHALMSCFKGRMLKTPLTNFVSVSAMTYVTPIGFYLPQGLTDVR
jgi:hypothetical protein